MKLLKQFLSKFRQSLSWHELHERRLRRGPLGRLVGPPTEVVPIPRWYGIAYHDYQSHHTFFYPLGINLIVGACRRFQYWLICPPWLGRTELNFYLFQQQLFQADEAARGIAFQERVAPWMQECFGPEVASDQYERQCRFGEEALELLQAAGMDRDTVLKLVDYVYGRPVGELRQEVGGTMVTLAAFCLAYDLHMDDEGERELARILRPEVIAKIRAKQAAKPKMSPLPGAYHDTY